MNINFRGLDTRTKDFLKTSFGNILEWYDFTIYGLFAIQLSKTFFPDNNHFISLLLVFSTFAIGFLARPIGSLIFGVIGDKYGKHYAVNLSVWFMAIPTALIGLLPGYNTLGIFSPAILILLRIFQGISAGGQFSGLIVIAVDSSNKNKTLTVSLIYTISVIGCLIASVIGSLSIVLFNYIKSTNYLINSLQWRIPFILSSIFFLSYIKLVPEAHKHNFDESKKFTFKEIFKTQPHELISMMLLNFGIGTIYYILFTYLVSYGQEHLHFSSETSFIFMNALLVTSIILYPIFGYIANSFNCTISEARKYCLLMIGAAICIGFIEQNLWIGLVGVILLVISLCAITSFLTTLFAEIFNKKYRMTACSLSFNFGMTLAGFAPLIAEIFSKLSTVGLSAFIFIIAITLVFTLKAILKTKGYQQVRKLNSYRDSKEKHYLRHTITTKPLTANQIR